MTTIAFKDGTLASDSQVTQNSSFTGSALKIGKLGPVLFGACGALPIAQKFMQWAIGGMVGECPRMAQRDGELVTEAVGVVFHGNHILEFNQYGSITLKAPYYATGSGGEFARGAMEAGASAQRALEVAMKLDIYTGGDITLLSQFD